MPGVAGGYEKIMELSDLGNRAVAVGKIFKVFEVRVRHRMVCEQAYGETLKAGMPATCQDRCEFRRCGNGLGPLRRSPTQLVRQPCRKLMRVRTEDPVEAREPSVMVEPD